MQFTTTIKHSVLMASMCLGLGACGGSDKHTPASQSEPVKKAEVVQPESNTLDYQALIDQLVSDEVPGILLYVRTPEHEFTGAAGIADLQQHSPMDVNSSFHIASSGKIFTALLASMLHEDGMLDLDNTLDTWLPDTLLDQIQYSDQITLRQLLNHSSGIYNYSDKNTYVEDKLANPALPVTNESLTQYALNNPGYFKPGADVHYSNTNYTLAGMILDKVLGYHNAIEIRNRIITPLSLDATFAIGYEQDQGELTPGYDYIDGEFMNVGPLFSTIWSNATPVASSVADLALLTRSLFKNSDFASESLQGLLRGSDSLVREDDNTQYALGMMKHTYPNATVYEHSGGNHGYSTQNAYIESHDTSIVLFLNCGFSSEECVNAEYGLFELLLMELTKAPIVE
ncbi:serine hydrolase domain-containing protein [Pseudoalteromonas sp. McH1-42]|uniref:serine hydrolase domain-containing protein n=1 Tax=Pseudoalteromonas sp. McH1-42 TaxID=2917752 RepID=UPI001EF56CD3|nr:serine hydrolase domain-containing protein [Pseudoalteromonas sp. McH1-42]MCG7563324.1 beta-lactamase family protein [Pseudoalteromonas sp. McH1-42]